MSNTVAARVVRMPLDFHALRSKSPMRLLEEAGVVDTPSCLTRASVLECLQEQPNLVEFWLQWSADKRVSEGWYFELGPPAIVAYYPQGERIEFASSLDACAEFVLREVHDLLRPAG